MQGRVQLQSGLENSFFQFGRLLVVGIISQYSLVQTTANAIAGVLDSKRQNDITELIVSTGCSFREAMELTEKIPKKTIFAARYRDYRIFENTIEHAVDTMKHSGIAAECKKQSDDKAITYTVTINRMV